MSERDKRPDETVEEWRERVLSPTGRMIWMDAEGTPFESRAVAETIWCGSAAPGEQSGTYFRSVRTRDGMTVWTHGRRDAETLAALREAGAR